MNIGPLKITVSQCTAGIYLRWWFNGWHHFLFTNGYEITMKTESQDIMTTQYFSVISKIERDTRITSDYAYHISLHGIQPGDIEGFTNLLLAERVEQYEGGIWREVDVTRGEHLIKDEGTAGYIFEFDITRKEIPGTSSVYQKSLKLYIGDTLCDMDDAEIIPINKQVNDIAQTQDRNSDFTAQFKIRKTRAMRDLFELSGEIGATTEFPYRRQPCRVIQDNIEIITNGILFLDRVTDQYYTVSIMSGNYSFFNQIAGLKISDLSLPTANHTWDASFMADTHLSVSPGIDVVYPLCEPSEDGSISPLTDDGDRVEMYGGWIWCFVRLRTIWEEIFENAGWFVVDSPALDEEIFSKLYIPIVRRNITDTQKYLYHVYNGANYNFTVPAPLVYPGAVLIKGDETFRTGTYTAPYTAKYKFSVTVFSLTAPELKLNAGLTAVATFEITSIGFISYTYEAEYDATAGEDIWISTTAFNCYYYSIQVTAIEDAKIEYGSWVEPRLYLPDMTQIDFIKMVCHVFGLVPSANARDHKIKFWNYQELYDNMPFARDWSQYLSERDDEVEFRFGDYAQHNYLRFKQSNDVIASNGIGELPFDDETLPEDKDIVQLAVSTCDEVRILMNVFSIDVSRIAFNKWNDTDATYDKNETVDARLVYVDYCREGASPVYQKEFWIRDTEAPLTGSFAGSSIQILTPKIASSLPVSFSSLIRYYAPLSRLLTKPNLRRAKMNLPVYEVAGLSHNIPVYLSQYKAYFYVNKVSNYVAGKLCTVELIRL